MKRLFLSSLCFLTAIYHVHSAEVPSIFKGIFEENQPRMGEVVVVMPVEEVLKLRAKVEQSVIKHPDWLREFSKKISKTEAPPFHENLGLTKEEHESLVAAWNKREFKVIEDLPLALRSSKDGLWHILSLGGQVSIDSLRFSPSQDTWKSSNGILKRVEDFSADAKSVLGEWKGKKWEFKEETTYSKIKESISIGQTADGKYNFIVYEAYEVSSSGSPVLNKTHAIRLNRAAAQDPKTEKPATTDKGKSATKNR